MEMLHRLSDVEGFSLGSNAVPDFLHQEDALGKAELIKTQGCDSGIPLETSSREMCQERAGLRLQDTDQINRLDRGFVLALLGFRECAGIALRGQCVDAGLRRGICP